MSINSAFEPGEKCPWCNLDLYPLTLQGHMCSERKKAAAAKLRAWELACADGRGK